MQERGNYLRIGLNHIRVHEAMTKLDSYRKVPIAWLIDDMFLNNGEEIFKPHGRKLLGEQINRS